MPLVVIAVCFAESGFATLAQNVAQQWGWGVGGVGGHPVSCSQLECVCDLRDRGLACTLHMCNSELVRRPDQGDKPLFKGHSSSLLHVDRDIRSDFFFLLNVCVRARAPVHVSRSPKTRIRKPKLSVAMQILAKKELATLYQLTS